MARQLKQAVIEASVPAAPVQSLSERVEDYLDSNGWNYSKGEGRQAFAMDVAVRDGRVRVVLNVVEAEGLQQVLVYSIFPIFVPEHSRARMAEGLSRINYATIFGNFEMDLSDGEVRVRTLAESDGALGEAMIARALRSNIDAASSYFVRILEVAFGNAAAETMLDPVTKDEATAMPQSTTLQ